MSEIIVKIEIAEEPVNVAIAATEVGGGASTFAGLTDAATADIPAVNGPLQTALAAKQPLSAALTATTSGFTIAQRDKLQGIAPNATANSAEATAATANTLVLRNAEGGASFGAISASGFESNGAIVFNGVDAGDSMTFNMVNYFYGTGSAAAHRTALRLGTTDAPTFAGATFNTGTITTSQPLALTQTWNNAAVTYTGLQVNVTDTASNAASLLMDLRVGGVSKIEVSKSGNLRVKSTSADGGPLGHAIGFDIGAFTWGFSNGGANSLRFGTLNDAHLYVTSAKQWRFAGTTNIGWAPTTPDGIADLLLARDASGTLAQRNGTNAQTFRLYKTYSSSGANYERIDFRWDGDVAKIGTQRAGSGSARDLVLETDGTERVRVLSTGDVGVGTAAPQGRLHIDSPTGKTALYFTGTSNNVPSVQWRRGSLSTNNSLQLDFPSNLAARWTVGDAVTKYEFMGAPIGIDRNNSIQFGGVTGQVATAVIGHAHADNNNGALLISTRASGTLAERMRITNTGNVGIGTASPAQRLDVVGSIKASQPIIFPSYTVAQLQDLTASAYTGGMAYCTNEADGATMVFCDGTNWRRVQDRAVIGEPA